MLSANELRQKYLEFFKSKGHTIIPSASLIPENDPSSLFTTAGMQPLVPFLMGEKHPAGNRIVDVQKCLRTGDIEDVGDNRHNTFFEMLGNWSLGDYFKEDAIKWSWEFLTDKKWLGLDPNRLYVTVFKGEDNIPRDEVAIRVWQEVLANSGVSNGVANEDEMIKAGIRIIPLGKDDNFWIAGATGPCGGDTEMFYDTRPEEGEINAKFSDLVNNFRLMEIWNDVFMEFLKTADGKLEKLAQQNVDTGMGMERTITVLNGYTNIFETELFVPLLDKIAELSCKKYQDNERAFRIIVDHIKAATMILGDEKGIMPSNVGAGYVLRRLIRRAVRYGKLLGIDEIFTFKIAEFVIDMYKDTYPEVKKNKEFVINQLTLEEEKFAKTLENGIKALKRIFAKAIGGIDPENLPKGMIIKDNVIRVDGNEIFHIYETYGLPPELSQEIMTEWGIRFDEQTMKESNEAFIKHQELSRTASAGMFKGGLADSSEQTTKLHTAAHLMLAALRQVLGSDVFQKGSNITSERLRFDFNFGQKMTPEQLKKVEDLANEQIAKNIPVISQEMTLDEAKKEGAMGVFEHKYGDKVKVYTIGDFSKEICGGPHVDNTGVLGHFKIQKEESSSAGVRRIKAILE
ncbi:MAG: alanine--tRNA ligase [Candidatus Parcubacteria bacterium]|nr:alanine--tRNA ligase [Candidatus Parcubacteria bacterium]